MTTSVSGEMRARVLNIAFALLALAILRASTPADAFNANYVNELLTAHAEEGYRDGGGGSGSGGEPKRVKIPVSTRGHIPDDWYSGEKSMDLHVGTLTVRRADATRGDARSLDRSIDRSIDRSSPRRDSIPTRTVLPFPSSQRSPPPSPQPTRPRIPQEEEKSDLHTPRHWRCNSCQGVAHTITRRLRAATTTDATDPTINLTTPRRLTEAEAIDVVEKTCADAADEIWTAYGSIGLASGINFFFGPGVEPPPREEQARSTHWTPYDRVGVVNAVP